MLKPSPHSGFTSDALAVATVSATGQGAWMVGPASLESVKANTPARARPEFPSLRPFTPGPYGSPLMFGGRGPGFAPQRPRTLYFEIVPDGVARVRWVFPRQVVGEFEPSTTAAVCPRPLTVNVPVRHNVAALELPPRGPATTETWYAADGRILASHGTAKDLNRIAPGARASSADLPVPPRGA